MSWIVLALSLVFSGINIVFSTQMCPLIGVLSDRVELGAVQGYFGRGSRTAAQPHSRTAVSLRSPRSYQGPGAITCHSPARPGGGVAVGVAPPAPPCSYYSVACQKIFCQTATKNELTGEQWRRETEKHSEGYFEDSIPLLSEHKQHLAFIAKNVCIGGTAWGWCDHYESFELDNICFQMKANPLTRWDHIISQSGEFRLLRFKSLAILVCTSLKA